MNNNQANQRPEEISGSFNYLCMNRLIKMNDAKADKDTHRYWTYFKISAQMLMSYMDDEIRQAFDKEFKEFDKLEKEWKESDIQQADITEKINQARFIFADSREYYLFQTLPKTGIVKNIEEGEIDFNKHDIKEIAKVIRSSETLGVKNV